MPTAWLTDDLKVIVPLVVGLIGIWVKDLSDAARLSRDLDLGKKRLDFWLSVREKAPGHIEAQEVTDEIDAAIKDVQLLLRAHGSRDWTPVTFRSYRRSLSHLRRISFFHSLPNEALRRLRRQLYISAVACPTAVWSSIEQWRDLAHGHEGVTRSAAFAITVTAVVLTVSLVREYRRMVRDLRRYESER